MSSQAAVSVSTCTGFDRRITVAITLKSLWAGFHLCFALSGLCSCVKSKRKIIVCAY